MGTGLSWRGNFTGRDFILPESPEGSQEGYVGQVFLDLNGGIEFKTETLDSYALTTDFATAGDDRRIARVLEFLRNYHKERFPWGRKTMLNQWLTEFFANPQRGTTPRELERNQKSYEKHQQHIDFMQHRLEEIPNEENYMSEEPSEINGKIKNK